MANNSNGGLLLVLCLGIGLAHATTTDHLRGTPRRKIRVPRRPMGNSSSLNGQVVDSGNYTMSNATIDQFRIAQRLLSSALSAMEADVAKYQSATAVEQASEDLRDGTEAKMEAQNQARKAEKKTQKLKTEERLANKAPQKSSHERNPRKKKTKMKTKKKKRKRLPSQTVQRVRRMKERLRELKKRISQDRKKAKQVLTQVDLKKIAELEGAKRIHGMTVRTNKHLSELQKLKRQLVSLLKTGSAKQSQRQSKLKKRIEGLQHGKGPLSQQIKRMGAKDLKEALHGMQTALDPATGKMKRSMQQLPVSAPMGLVNGSVAGRALLLFDDAVGHIPYALVPGEAQHTTLSDSQVDKVARVVLSIAEQDKCQGKGEYGKPLKVVCEPLKKKKKKGRRGHRQSTSEKRKAEASRRAAVGDDALLVKGPI